MRADEILDLARRDNEEQKQFRHRINVCCSSGCIPVGALEVLAAF